MIRVAITTLGCKVNRADGEALMASLGALATEVPFREKADLYIINSCTVTATADRQSRQLINRARRTNPGARVVLSGCMAAVLDQGALEKLGVDRAFTLAGHDQLVAYAGSIEPDAWAHQARDQIQAQDQRGKDRAVLKIQDGCDCSCSYCIVPTARGKGTSVPPEQVRADLDRLAAQRYAEVVLTGIHLGCYGQDLSPPTSLEAFLRSRSAGGPRLRLSSIEPLEVTQGIQALILGGQGPELCPHLHIPIQSGHDRILEAMGRPYRLAQVEDLLLRLRGASPDLALGTDLMAGFPGEDEEAFLGSLRLVERSPLTHLHVFPFSRRSGTPAADMPGQVSKAVAKERARALRQAGAKKLAAFTETQLGQVRPVVVEGKPAPDGRLTGMTDNYLRVRFKGPAELRGEVVEARLERVEEGGVGGELA